MRVSELDTKEPRPAYCTGCGVTFAQMHKLRQHRWIHHCGGQYLPIVEKELYAMKRLGFNVDVAIEKRRVLRMADYVKPVNTNVNNPPRPPFMIKQRGKKSERAVFLDAHSQFRKAMRNKVSKAGIAAARQRLGLPITRPNGRKVKK